MSGRDSRHDGDGSRGANSGGGDSVVGPEPAASPEPNLETSEPRTAEEVGASVRMMSSTMTPAGENMKPVFDYSGISGLSTVSSAAASALASMKAASDYSAGFAGLGILPAGLAAAVGNMKPVFDYSGISGLSTVSSAGFAGLGILPAGLAAAVGSVKPVFDYSGIAGLSTVSSAAASALASMKAASDFSAGFAGLGILPAGLAAAVGSVKPVFDYSGIAGLSTVSSAAASALASMKAASDFSAGFAGLGILPAGLATTMADLANSRLLMLGRGFARRSGDSLGVFGELERVVTSDLLLKDPLRRAVATTQRVGSFGLDYKSLQRDAADLSVRLGDEPDLERRVRSALEPVQEITGLTDELLLELGGVLGLWTRIAHHKISTSGIFFGFTVGLTAFVFGAGSGISQVPSAVVQAIILGGGIYGFVHRQEKEINGPAK